MTRINQARSRVSGKLSSTVLKTNTLGDRRVEFNPMWLAGAGVKKGYSYGSTDEYGIHAVEGRMHTTDLHATLLALLGLDHEKLSYRYAGRNFRLTDVAGNPVTEIFA